MSNVRELHDKAMQLAQLALIARHNQEWEKAESLARQSYEYEVQAAEFIPEDKSSEPTRSILYRSAASLAYQCKEFDTAQRLIAKGLSGYPPPQIEQELKDLYEQVNFEYHLKVRGVTLANEDLQLSMQGKSVGSGMILYDEFIKRIRTTHTIIDRTIQRLMGANYIKSKSSIPKKYCPFTPTLSTARPGSFAITIRLGVTEGDQIPLFVTPANVIDEILTGIELINNSDEKGLLERIKIEGYYRHFLVSTRDIAPDGDKIRFVGFTSSKRAVSLTKQRNEISEIKITTEPGKREAEESAVKVEGLLDFASARKKKGAIGLTTKDGDEYNIIVEEGLDDLVRSYFSQWVVITGLSKKKNIYLKDIQSIE